MQLPLYVPPSPLVPHCSSAHLHYNLCPDQYLLGIGITTSLGEITRVAVRLLWQSG